MIFHNCSQHIYNWILNQNHVKEESLTDWLLYEISQQCPSIYYKAFSRHEEAQNGSDWEWWILTTDSNGLHKFNAYRFVVQAKKLLPDNQDNYRIINYTNRYGTQIDLLLNFAKDRNALPLYMYYSIGNPDILKQIENLTYLSEQTIRWCENCTNGCFLILASDVYDLVYKTARKKISDGQLLNHSFKLSLLDIGFDYCGIDIDKTLNNFNNRLISEKKLDNVYFNNQIHGIKYSEKTIPRYLNVFIEHRKGELNWFENEMRITDIGGLGVIDIRKK